MSAPAIPTTSAILHLYRSMLRTSRAFSSYNFRQYFITRTKSTFREIQNENDPTKLSSFYDGSLKELSVLRRSAVVNQLYGGSKLVIEKDNKGGKL